jgi:TPR repeat protein
MAQTFDPDFLKSYFVQGLKPDLAKAEFWYNKAMQLGSAEAKQRLATLSAAQ